MWNQQDKSIQVHNVVSITHTSCQGKSDISGEENKTLDGVRPQSGAD